MKTLSCGMLAALALPLMAGQALADGCGATPFQPSNAEQDTPITLDTAVKRASQAAPEVLLAAFEARASLADADQAGRRLNPSASFETENFAGTGPLRGFSTAENTLVLEQTFRLGGKRRLSERAARAEAALASARCEVMRLESQTLAGELFLDLQAAIETAEVAADAAKLAGEFSDVVSRRVEAGASAPPELLRSQTEEVILQAAADAAAGEVEARALALASVWGRGQVDFALPGPASEKSYQAEMKASEGGTSHPRLAEAKAGVEARRAAADLARAGAWPDVTLSAGFRNFEQTGDNAFLAGVSVPLPLFDRNRDAARGARLRSQGAALNADAVEARLRAQQARLVARSRTFRSRLDRLEGEALPLAEQAYAAAAEGYRVGKFDLTAALDARRNLIETRSAVIDARLSFEIETLRLRALIGAAPFNGDTQ
jgi:cobalt-zinc-cadmium efflux system outer membrane protein